MDDDVPLILTLDDSGSSASAPLDELDREELPNESKSALSVPARCLSRWGGRSARWDGRVSGARCPGLPLALLLTAPCDTAGPDGSYLCDFYHTFCGFPCDLKPFPARSPSLGTVPLHLSHVALS